MPIYFESHVDIFRPTYGLKNKVESFTFSGGEQQVQLSKSQIATVKEKDHLSLLAVINNSKDVMDLLLTVDAIRNISPDIRLYLSMPYLPYARQDRACVEGEAFSLRVFSKLINSMNFKKVVVTDPHSIVYSSYLDGVTFLSQLNVMIATYPNIFDFFKNKKPIIVAPDKGAASKSKIAADFFGVECIVATKVRDPYTGHLSKPEVLGDVNGKNVFIIDDICDGGRTFVNLAVELKAQGAKEIYLYTTFGIYSNGLEELRKHFTKIMCGIPHNIDQLWVKHNLDHNEDI